MAAAARSLRLLLRRGLRRRCPRCGEGALFRRYTTLLPRCPACGYPYAEREGSCYFFHYLSTAAITGVFLGVAGYGLIVHPRLFAEHPVAAWTPLVLAQVALILATSPLRKALAMALDCYFAGG